MGPSMLFIARKSLLLSFSAAALAVALSLSFAAPAFAEASEDSTWWKKRREAVADKQKELAKGKPGKSAAKKPGKNLKSAKLEKDAAAAPAKIEKK